MRIAIVAVLLMALSVISANAMLLSIINGGGTITPPSGCTAPFTINAGTAPFQFNAGTAPFQLGC